jgi:hypothetical protein
VTSISFQNLERQPGQELPKDLNGEERVFELIKEYGREYKIPEWLDVLEMKDSMERTDSHEVREIKRQMKPGGEPGKYAKFTNQFEALLKIDNRMDYVPWTMYEWKSFGHVLEICKSE